MFADLTRTSLSQIHGTAGARAVMSWSILPQVSARCFSSVIVTASAISLLIVGSSSCGQLELFDGLMLSPLNGTWRMDCGSLKSLIHPTFGHTFGSFDGTEQNFVYMMLCSTGWKFTLNPSCSSWFLNTSAVSLPGGASSPTIVMSHTDPSHLPLLNPAFFMYEAASCGSPFGF